MAVIPTGSIALDVALGVGGLPRGRVVEIYGPESSGKTTVALHAVASAQMAGGIAAFIDAEHALDADYARALGVDTDALLVSQPDTGEPALEIADMVARSGALEVVVIDSGAALVPRAGIEGEKNKCVAEGTVVFEPVTGRAHRIEEVVDGRLPISVVAAAKNGALGARPVVAWFDQGEQDVLGVRLRGGATLWATPDHKVLTDRGWKLAGELRQGDRVAQPRQFLGFGAQEPYSRDHARLLGYLIGDGYVGG